MIEESRELLGSEVKIIVPADGEDATAAVLMAFGECKRIEEEYSRFIDDNQLAALNSAIGKWAAVSEELYGLLRVGEELRVFSGGAFDLTVKGILESWGYDKGYSLQEKNEVAGLGRLEFADDFKVRISAEVDLGGLGKGYALDRMVACLDGLNDFCINAGGDIFARGRNTEGDLWKILFEHPVDNSMALGFVEVDDMVLAGSSPSKRRWRNRHHIVDPLKMEPANEMLAVYVQADKGILADAYATALFAMGYPEAKLILNNIPVETMLIGPDGAIVRSDGFKGELFID